MKTENSKVVFEDDEIVVRYNDTPELRQKVFDMILGWFKDQGLFTGESVMQCDAVFESGPDLLADMADDVFGFDIEDKEEFLEQQS